MTDLGVILILSYKDEMIKLGIIPEDVKWDCLSEEQKQGVINFITDKIEKQKGGKIND